MQEATEAHSLDDDMVDGDLGDGMGVRAAPNPTRNKSQSFAGVTESLLPGAEWLRQSSQTLDTTCHPGLKIAETQWRACWKVSRSGKIMTEVFKKVYKPDPDPETPSLGQAYLRCTEVNCPVV